MNNFITKEYLKNHPNEIFVFGDNVDRIGLGGAAILRNESNSYGFITKKHPNNDDDSFFTPKEYKPIFKSELNKLIFIISFNKDKIFLISKLGAGLANKYNIFEEVISKNIRVLEKYNNVKFLW